MSYDRLFHSLIVTNHSSASATIATAIRVIDVPLTIKIKGMALYKNDTSGENTSFNIRFLEFDPVYVTLDNNPVDYAYSVAANRNNIENKNFEFRFPTSYVAAQGLLLMSENGVAEKTREARSDQINLTYELNPNKIYLMVSDDLDTNLDATSNVYFDLIERSEIV